MDRRKKIGADDGTPSTHPCCQQQHAKAKSGDYLHRRWGPSCHAPQLAPGTEHGRSRSVHVRCVLNSHQSNSVLRRDLAFVRTHLRRPALARIDLLCWTSLNRGTPMDRVGAYEAKSHLPRLLDRVARGESLTITRHGQPVARLVPVEDDEYRRRDQAARRILRRRGHLNRAPLAELLTTMHEGHRF